MNVTTPPRARAQLLLALSQQNWAQLDELMDDLADAMGEEEAQDYLRGSVLPQCSTTAAEAFWRHCMTEGQFSELMEHMAMAAAHRLEADNFTLGTDYSFTIRDDGLRQLLCSDAALECLRNTYQGAKFSTLRILLV